MTVVHLLLVLLLLTDLLLTRRGKTGIVQWFIICLWFFSGMMVGWPQ